VGSPALEALVSGGHLFVGEECAACGRSCRELFGVTAAALLLREAARLAELEDWLAGARWRD